MTDPEIKPSPMSTSLTGTIPSGLTFTTRIAVDLCVLRVGDRVCVAAPRWMTLEQARDVGRYLAQVSS